jgi:hypothetical protein
MTAVHGTWQPAVPWQYVGPEMQQMTLVPVGCTDSTWMDRCAATGSMVLVNVIAVPVPPVPQVHLHQLQQTHMSTDTMTARGLSYVDFKSCPEFAPAGAIGLSPGQAFPEFPRAHASDPSVTAFHSSHRVDLTGEVTAAQHRQQQSVCMPLQAELAWNSVKNVGSTGSASHLDCQMREQESIIDDLSLDGDALDEPADLLDKYESMSFVSSEASTVASRSARRRRGRRAAKAKAVRVPSTIPILESPSLDEIVVTAELKSVLSQQLEAGGLAKRKALERIHGSVRSMAFEPFGCRIVQQALDVADATWKESLVAELHGHVREAISSPHANFVIQKAIEVLPVTSVSFVAEEMLTFAVDAARHRFACRILCRLVEHHLCNVNSSHATGALIDELLLEAESLIHHNFARHVIELILEHGSADHKRRIAIAIRKDILHNSKSRYASYVIEQAMIQCSINDQDAIASKLVSHRSNFLALATHECGSHVVKAVLLSRGAFAKHAKELLFQEADKVKASKYGQRLLDETQ